MEQKPAQNSPAPAARGGAAAVPRAECTEFLQWALPRMGFRWAGFRKVRRQVCRRIARRIGELGYAGAGDYRAHLERTPKEWDTLALLCRVTISRFWRDRSVFERLRAALCTLPRGSDGLRVWSAGCGAGEEPYSVALACAAENVPVTILATDIDQHQLERAATAEYPTASRRELPADLAAIPLGDVAGSIEFRRSDIRRDLPDGPFDLILCRNLVFTYFDAPTQQHIAAAFRARLSPGGWLILGKHEQLPVGAGWTAVDPHLRIYTPSG